MPTPYRKLQVFICHASQDKPIARELYQHLFGEGWIDPWLDEEKLTPGMTGDMEIEKAVEASDAVIVCLSSKSVSKEGYIQRELKFVLDIAFEKPEGAIFVIPLRLDECQVPRRLRTWQYVDYFPLNKAGIAYSKLLASLEARANLLGINIEKAKEYFQKDLEEKAQKEAIERIRREAKEKVRREEENKLRQEAEERARIEIMEEVRKLAEEGKRKEAAEREEQEKELVRKKTEEHYKRSMELLERKRVEEETEERRKREQEEPLPPPMDFYEPQKDVTIQA